MLPNYPIFMVYRTIMEYFHPLLSEDYLKLNSIFSYVCFELGKRLQQDPSYGEPGLTTELFHQLRQRLKELKLANYFINLHMDRPSEKKTGADIAFRIRLNFPEVHFDRYILLQAKKYLADKDRFSETNPGNVHLSGQVAKMHQFNPEFSYLLLYSTGEFPTGNMVNSRPWFGELSWWFDPLPEAIFDAGKPSPIRTLEGNYPVTVLRASTWQSIHDDEPKSLLNYASCFPEFILNDLVTGKIGKKWDTQIQDAQGQFSFVVTLAIGQG